MENPSFSANSAFSLALLKQLSDDNKTGNIFFSPFSISSALAMVMLGAGGNTVTQMSERLLRAKSLNEFPEEHHFLSHHLKWARKPSDQSHGVCRLVSINSFLLCPQCLKTKDCCDDVHSSFAQLLSELNKSDAPYSLSVANRLYGEQSYQFVEDFLGKTRKHYNAELEAVNFIESYDAARLNINSWVEKQTQGKIKDLLAEGVLNSLTRLVLVNAIYFKGLWNKQFKEDQTRDAQFRLNKVILQLHEHSFSLIYIHTQTHTHTHTHGNGRKTPSQQQWKSGTCEKVICMSPANDLVLSKVVHKAFVEVNEEGTEAAAATAAIMMLRCARIPDRFIADHPFLFFIRHNPSMSILFAGRYCSPV
uniref:Serpin B6 n=1 Tax=Amphilophus citrinellus TaxID=61819 RepID=A0A3Q0RMU4_AMPCI